MVELVFLSVIAPVVTAGMVLVAAAVAMPPEIWDRVSGVLERGLRVAAWTVLLTVVPASGVGLVFTVLS